MNMFLLSLLLAAAKIIDGFAGWYSVNIYSLITATMGRLTGRVPFSVAEAAVCILPFVIMVAVLSLCLWLTGNEGIAALAGIASLVPYYAVVYHCKDKLARRFAFVIEE